MSLITVIMLTFVDVVSIILSIIYINDQVIEMGIVLSLVFLLMIFIYKLFRIVIDEIEYAYVDFKKGFDEERNLNDTRFKEEINILKNSNEVSIKIINEININIILLNKYVQENNKELVKLFEVYFNQMKVEFSNQNKINVDGVINLSEGFKNKIEKMGKDFNYNLGQVKEKLTEGLLEYNTVLQHSLNSNLNGLHDNTNNLLNNITLKLSNNNDELQKVFDSSIKTLTSSITKSSMEVNETLNNNLNSLDKSLEKNSGELHSYIDKMVKICLESNSNLVERNTINSNDLFARIAEDRMEQNKILNDNSNQIYENISKNTLLLLDKVTVIGDINQSTLKNIEVLTKNLITFETSINTSILDLTTTENKLISDITINNKNLYTTLSEGILKLNNTYTLSSDANTLVLNELKSVVVDMGALIDDSIVLMKNGIKEENIRNSNNLGVLFEKQIKDLNRRLQEGNRGWQDVSEELGKNNTQTIMDVKRSLMDMNSLHRELLKSLNDNQKRMLELNEEDIKLMRDMII